MSWGISFLELRVLNLATSEYRPVDRDPLSWHAFTDVVLTLQSSSHLERLTLSGQHVLIAPTELTISTTFSLPICKMILRHGSGCPLPHPLLSLLATLKAGPNMSIEIDHRDQYYREDRTEPTRIIAQAPSALHLHLQSRGQPSLPAAFPVIHLMACPPARSIIFRLGFKTLPLPAYNFDWRTGEMQEPHGIHTQYEIVDSEFRGNWDAQQRLRVASLLLARSLPFDHWGQLKQLVLTALYWAENDFVSVLGSARRVEVLTIYESGGMDRTTPTFIRDLLQVPMPNPGSPSGAPAGIMFPALRSLHLRHVNFMFPAEHESGALVLLRECLTETSRRRHALTCGLQSLHIDQCDQVPHQSTGTPVTIT